MRTLLRSSSILLGLALLIGALHAPTATAQQRGNDLPRVSPNAVVQQTIGITNVRIAYGRPSVRGRTIFGGLVSYDEVWRTGANEATTITFSDDVMIEGEPIDAGRYGLFTIPGEESWTIIINDVGEQWGAFNYDESRDVVRVEVTPESTARPWEMMTFTFESVTDSSAHAVLSWAETRVPFRIDVNTTEVIRQRANEAAANASNWQTPFQYAAYALQNDAMLDDALRWVNRSIELEENFNNLAVKAQLLATMGDYGEAVSVGERAVDLGQSMDEAPRGLDQLQQSVDSWRSQM